MLKPLVRPRLPGARGSLVRSRVVFVAAPAVLWLTYSLVILLYAAIRSVGDSLLPWHDGQYLERSIFGFVPTAFVQDRFYRPDSVWLDYTGFLLHSGWFFLPLIFGLVVTLVERKRLMEFLGWIVAASYLSDVFFLAFPVTPPWMETGISRILYDRSFVKYTEFDSNPVAAFPSMHAALPLVIGLFFILRCGRTRWLGWLAVLYALLVGLDVVYLGEHWVIDVLAGYALAAVVAVLFANHRLRRAYARIPGDPIGRLTALNEAMSRHAPRGTRPEVIPEVAVPEKRAA